MRTTNKILFFLIILLLESSNLMAQDDLLSLLEDDEPTENYTSATFKTTRVINLQSVEVTAPGVFDFKISHRFGFINGGFSELFGLDGATIRFGGDFGITNRLTIGVGRSSLEKTYDSYLKYKFLKQQSGKKNIPFTAVFFASTAINTLPFRDPDRENYFSSRLFYTYQLILGRKFNENFSLQLSPTVVHRNLVRTSSENNDVYALGIGFRQKLNKRFSINAEYIYVLPNQLAPGYRNSFSLGVDIETGGHVFQLHLTNSTSMIEKGFITETVGKWFDGGVHLGFNISRVFTINKPKIN